MCQDLTSVYPLKTNLILASYTKEIIEKGGKGVNIRIFTFITVLRNTKNIINSLNKGTFIQNNM